MRPCRFLTPKKESLKDVLGGLVHGIESLGKVLKK
jgi:hypothetical protein